MKTIKDDLECSTIEPESVNTSMEMSTFSQESGSTEQESVVEPVRCITPTPFATEPVTPDKMFRPIQPVQEETLLSQYSGGIAPKQQDTLFWCIYIIANGYGEYINIDRNYGVAELENKKKIADYIRVNGSKMKQTNYKITKAAVQEIMSEFLTNQKDTSFQCLLALCVYHNINIVILHNNNKLMLEFMYEVDYGIDDKENPFYVLKKDGYGKYSVDTEKKTWKEVQEMKNQYVCLDNHMKPMKAASHYKIEDLDTLADKLGVLDVTKKYKKAELYHLVNEAMNWYK